ncbi:hypothetical protein F4680DRAFT_442939 [Xylaria scruposa]|nr:hypothetical protein F4680DRAFT_442939 [Xylaria scruposa]
MVSPYRTTIFEDARKVPKKHINRFRMDGPIVGNAATHYFHGPINPFKTLQDRQEHARRAAADAAWAARQHELYNLPGANLTPDMRCWNGRRFVASPTPGLIASIIGAFALIFAAIKAMLSDEIFDLPNGRTVRCRDALIFWLDRGYYHFLQYWRAAMIQLGFLIEAITRILLFLCTIGIIFAVLLKVALMFDPRPGEVEWVLVREYRSWSVVTY